MKPAARRAGAPRIPDPPTATASARVVGMPPVIGKRPRVLVLGSMPGAASLQLREYYAHPQNQFWRIVEDVLQIPRDRPYAARIAELQHHGIALWDVLATCHRRGSLDADIRRNDMQLNDIGSLLAAHRSVTRVVFNGAFAEKVYRTRLDDTNCPSKELRLQRLPSTSPAHAALGYAQKLAAWREALI